MSQSRPPAEKDWVIEDSEDERESALIPKPPMQSHSTISDYSAGEIILPAADHISTISDFTTSNVMKMAETTTDNILVPSTSSDPPAKPKRPKPRPAYGRSLNTGTRNIYDSISVASVTASAINRIGPGSVSEPLLDMSFSRDAVERTRSHDRSTTGGSADRPGHIRSPDIFKNPNSIVEGSSKDIVVILSSDAEQEQAAMTKTSKKPLLPSAATATSTRPSSPPFEPILNNLERTPPSSPFQPRRKKRRTYTEEIHFSDENRSAENDITRSSTVVTKDKEPPTKRQKRSKEKKAREGKTKTGAEGDAISTTKTIRKRESKTKEKASEQEFKSKEFVEDSDDDLLLVPNSACRSSHAEPTSADTTVRASVDVSVQPSAFIQTETAVASVSVLPSFPATVLPSVAISELPSADISAPPPSPSMAHASRSDRSKSEKRKKKSTKLIAHNLDTAGKDDTFGGESGHDGVSGNMLAGELGVTVAQPKKKGKKGKVVEPCASQDTSEKRDALLPEDLSDSAEKVISEAGKSRSGDKKDRKKRAVVVSSDEDEPAETEGNKTKIKESSRDDKENQTLSPPKDRPEKTPAPPPSTCASPAQVRSSNSKSQLSTPKMPLRKDSMSALIRRVSSKVQSPLRTPSPAYSPLAKASRTTLSRIAPLHPNRRTPPPPPPRPPAPKKSKKMLELEEKWEEELAETVEGWSCMTDEERAALRRARRDAELGYDD